MSFNQREFRDTLAQFVTGVTVITTRDTSGSPAGITANSFNSVSLDPPLILWSIGRDANSLAAFESATHFAVHILSEDQVDLSTRFATVGADKFTGLKTQAGLGDVPLIDHAVARLECSVFERVPAGDHIIYIGKVERLQLDRTKSPLVYHSGDYAKLQSAASIA